MDAAQGHDIEDSEVNCQEKQEENHMIVFNEENQTNSNETGQEENIKYVIVTKNWRTSPSQNGREYKMSNLSEFTWFVLIFFAKNE